MGGGFCEGELLLATQFTTSFMGRKLDPTLQAHAHKLQVMSLQRECLCTLTDLDFTR